MILKLWAILYLYAGLEYSCVTACNPAEFDFEKEGIVTRNGDDQHYLETALHSSELFWRYIDTPIIVLLGGGLFWKKYFG